MRAVFGTFGIQTFDESDGVVCVWTKRDDRGGRLQPNNLFVKLIGIVTAGEELHARFGSQGPANVFEVFESGAQHYY